MDEDVEAERGARRHRRQVKRVLDLVWVPMYLFLAIAALFILMDQQPLFPAYLTSWIAD